MDLLRSTLRDLVVANRILGNEGVMDAYGHISARHPSKPDRYLLSRSRSPELVTAKDIMEFTLDGVPVGKDRRPPYIERFIHGAIYESRPEIQAVVHSHAYDVVPFSISRTRLAPVWHSGACIGAHVPVWDIQDKFGDATNLLVTNTQQGRDLAQRLGSDRVVLMRGHGFAAAGRSIAEAVRMAIYMPRNARIMMEAMRMGEYKPLSPGEIEACSVDRPNSPERRRAWEYWARRAGCGRMLEAEAKTVRKRKSR